MDVSVLRNDFPFLAQQIDGHTLCYLDTAATAQMPQVVFDAMDTFEVMQRSNVHRGMYDRADKATQSYENARATVRDFLHARHAHEIIFTKNATESINLVARSFGDQYVQAGGVIILSILEHHSNIVPWQQLAARTGCAIAWVGVDQNGTIDMEHYRALLALGAVRMVALTAQSNMLGTKLPLQEMITLAHEADACTLVDASQLAVHHSIHVTDLDCDFLVCSGHKLYGPLGIGVLYGKEEVLADMQPFLGGGTMMHQVDQEGFTPAELPQRFEAGTPPITQAVGLATAVNWLTTVSVEERELHEHLLMEAAHEHLSAIEGLTILGPQDPVDRSGCISFTVDGVHPHDLTDLLGAQGICLRAGHHCAEPLHEHFGIHATTRLSIGLYNTVEEVERCAEAITEAITTFSS